MITVDKNLRFQQRIGDFSISIIVLDVLRNDLASLTAVSPHLPAAFSLVSGFGVICVKPDGVLDRAFPR